MLARIAYQLYWVGRYVARAEHTARLLDGIFQASLQARTPGRRQALSWESVMAIMGSEHMSGPISSADAVRSLTLDPESPASVTACIKRARQGTRTVRDVVSAEMWEALNTLYLELNSSDLGSALKTGPYSVYSFVRERCVLWWGLADETMLRDSAYAFLSTGRHAESAEMIVRMLRVALSPLSDSSDPSVSNERALAILQAVGGLEAFRRAETSLVETGSVAEFLIYAENYPHSVTASLKALHDALEDAGRGADAGPAAPKLRLARLRAELEFSRASGDSSKNEESLVSLLQQIQRELVIFDREVESHFFVGERDEHQVLGQ